MNKISLSPIGSFPCEIRKSKRVKYAQVRVSTRGVEVLLPFRYAMKEGETILREKRAWIEAELAKLQPPLPIQLPSQVHLTALNEQWTICTHLKASKAKLTEKTDKILLLQGQFETDNLWQTLLQRWLKKKALAFLPPLLKHLSQATQLPFNTLSIRGQRTRWGSCSVRKNINLNYQILFLPYEMAQHILLHELCHTAHLNHGKQFWALLEQLDPDTVLHEKKLKKPHLFVPNWV